MKKVVLFLLLLLLLPAWGGRAQTPVDQKPALEALKELATELETDLPHLRQARHGFIDRRGKLVIPARFEDAQGFAEGLAGVKLDGKWGYLDKTGAMAIPAQFARIEDFAEVHRFREGLAVVETARGTAVINRQGRVVIKSRGPGFSRFSSFFEGRAVFLGPG